MVGTASGEDVGLPSEDGVGRTSAEDAGLTPGEGVRRTSGEEAEFASEEDGRRTSGGEVALPPGEGVGRTSRAGAGCSAGAGVGGTSGECVAAERKVSFPVDAEGGDGTAIGGAASLPRCNRFGSVRRCQAKKATAETKARVRMIAAAVSHCGRIGGVRTGSCGFGVERLAFFPPFDLTRALRTKGRILC